MVEDLKAGGSFLLNCSWSEKELEDRLPNKMKKYIAENNIKFYVIDGIKIGKEIGLGGRINTILQSAFFKIANIIPANDAIQYMKDAATKSYSKKGEKIVAMNHTAIERGMSDLKEIKVPEAWKNLKIEDNHNNAISCDSNCSSCANCNRPELLDYVNNILKPVNEYKGNKLPVSAFVKYVDGTAPQGSAAFEKRGVAVDVPEWIPENCIECNFCSMVCPHAVIRPTALTEKELKNAPEGTKYKEFTGMDGKKFSVTISPLDCTGCGACVNVCPGKKGEKALSMKPIDTQMQQQKVFDYAVSLPEKKDVIEKFKETTVKGSQFKQPLLEFSGACAGCGETPYAKLVTQLFGDRMYIANATGCSSIWGGSAPATPYTVNQKGKGPAWQNSLFEDNAEFGFGMALAQNAIRGRLKNNVEEIEKVTKDEDLKFACQQYIESFSDSGKNAKDSEILIKELENIQSEKSDVSELAKKVLNDKDYLSKKSMWIFGGDGWAYDIGFGGLDHVIASGENVNVLVFDTEVYSNTGGQASKSTPTGSIAQFAAGGKTQKKKDLAAIAMSYGYVYVAQIAMGANYNQCVKAFSEAESFNGPSLIIAYAPCINHGIKGGMGIAQQEEKKAVESGYWNLFRFDPRLSEVGKNPFTLDSKAPTASYRDFIMNEVRYNALARSFPDKAEALFKKAEQQAQEKYEHLKHLSGAK